MGAIQKELKELRWYWKKNDKDIKQVRDDLNVRIDQIADLVEGILDILKPRKKVVS